MTTPSTELTVVTDIPSQLVKADVLTELAPESSAALIKAFTPHFTSFYKLLPEAKAIAPDSPKAARIMRLKVREIRLDSDKTRIATKAESARRVKAIDGIHNLLLNDLAPVEESLTVIEKMEETREANRKEGLRVARTAQLVQYQDPSFVTHYDLANMSAAHFDQLLAQTKLAKETADAATAKAEADRIEAARVAEETRLAKEAADRAERDRLAAENKRLADIAAQEKAARETEARENARKLKEAADTAAKKLADERKAADAKAAQEKATRDAADAQRLAEQKARDAEAAKMQAAKDDAARKQREAAELVAKQEREKREALEAAETARKAAEAKRVADEQAAAKRAAAAPDKTKLTAFAAAIRALPVPTLATTPLQTKIAEQVEKFAKWVETEGGKL